MVPCKLVRKTNISLCLSLTLYLYLYRHGEKKLNIIPYFLIAQLHAIAQLFFLAALKFFETFNGFILMAFAYWVAWLYHPEWCWYPGQVTVCHDDASPGKPWIAMDLSPVTNPKIGNSETFLIWRKVYGSERLFFWGVDWDPRSPIVGPKSGNDARSFCPGPNSSWTRNNLPLMLMDKPHFWPKSCQTWLIVLANRC